MKPHRLILLAVFVLLCMIVSPVYAVVDWTGSVATSSSVQTAHVNHFHAYSGNVSQNYWGVFDWYYNNQCSLRFYGSSDLYDVPIEVKRTSDNLTVITGTLDYHHTGSQDCNLASHWHYTIDFGNQKINSSYVSGQPLTVYGAFGTTYTNYYGAGSGTPSFAPPFIISQAEGYSSCTAYTFDTDNGPLLDAPVADFSCNPFWTVMGNMTLCSYTGTGGEPDTYLWEAWRPYEDPEYDEPMTSEYDTLGVQVNYFGWYPVNLTVCNEAGCSYDFTFGFKGIYSDNMTQLNITPQQTIALIPTGIANIINKTNLRDNILNANNSFANLTVPFLDTVDFFADGVNASFSEIIGIFTIPLSWMTGALTGVTSDINNIAVPLVSQSTIFLNVIGRSLAALPVILINIVTLALLLDIVRIVIRGVGGM